MARLSCIAVVVLFLGLLLAEPTLAFRVDANTSLDDTTRQPYVTLSLPDCQGLAGKAPGLVTPHLSIPQLEHYMVSSVQDRGIIEVRGPFRARTTYTITIHGALCQQPETTETVTVTTHAHEPAVEFLSRGIYFSKLHPSLRFRHRELSTIHWTIYRIDRDNRYLLSRTEGFRVNPLQSAGVLDTTTRVMSYLSYLDAYPGQRFTTVSRLRKARDWRVDALDLTPYAQAGDWLVVVARSGAEEAAAADTTVAMEDEEAPDAEEQDASETASTTAQDEETERLESFFSRDDSPGIANIVVQFTNLGVYVRKHHTGLWGQVLAIDIGESVLATIRFKQKNGKVLYQTDTDAQGAFRLPDNVLASIAPHLHRIEAVQGEDSVEVFLKDGAFSLRSFPIAGVNHRLPLQAFVYSDRGLYRLGETVHLTTLLRHWDLRTPAEDVSAEFILEGPTGRVRHIPLPGTAAHDGAASWSWSVPSDASTGKYRAEVHYQGALIGVGTFAVEQIIPPTIEATVHLQEPYATWDPTQAQFSTVTGTVTGRFLFGAPATGKAWEYRCVLEAGHFKPAQYADFVFQDALKVFQPQTFHQQEDMTLDNAGNGTLACTHSQSLSTEMVRETLPGVGSMKVVADVFEEGGRSVQASQAIPVYFHAVYPGIRPVTTGTLEYGQPAQFHLIAIDPLTGHPKAGVKLLVELYEKDYRSWYYFHRRSRPVVESEVQRQLRFTAEVVSGAEPVLHTITPPGCCAWELRVSVAATGASSRVAFDNGAWWESAGMGASPSSLLTLQADKEHYAIGDTANVLITAPFDGTLILVQEQDGQPLHTERLAVVNKTALYQMPISQAQAPWFHLNAVLLRTVPTTPDGFQVARETPYRAVGLLPLQVHPQDAMLTLAIQAPPQIRPGSTMPLVIRAQDAHGAPLSGPVWLTVAVVDEGILNMMRFTTPAPYNGLHRRPAYTTAWFDTFGQVVPYSLHDGDSAFGGDEGFDMSQVQRVKPMAWWSGIVPTDASGTLTLEVPVHDYTGRVRVMMVGWQGKRTGSAQAQTLVFAPVDMHTSLPRVVGVFDRTQAVAEVLNNTDDDQTVTVSCITTGALHLAEATEAAVTVQVPARRSHTVRWPVAGTGVPGKAEVTFLARSASGETRQRRTELLVRPVSAPIEVVTPFLLPGGESQQVHLPDARDFAPGTGQWEVTLSTSPAVKLAKHVQYLVGYPHGCLEQTTSRLFAMLLLKPTLGPEVLAQYLDAKTRGSIDTFLDEGVRKLAKMQMADGGFAFWLGDTHQYPWLNVYATHFLWKARQLQYTVPDEVYTKALQKLRAQFSDVQLASQPEVLAYAAFVLALNGQISKGDLQWLVSRLQAPAAQAQATTLAVANTLTQAAMTQLHQPPQAHAVLRGLPEVSLETPAAQWWRAHYFLSRDAAFAARLYTGGLARDTNAGALVPSLIEMLAAQDYVSTHTISWALLAVDSVFAAPSGAIQATITTSAGTTRQVRTTSGENQTSGLLQSGESGLLTIHNTDSERALFGYVTSRGWPERPPRQGFNTQIELQRLYLDEAGDVLMPPLTVTQGQRLFVMLRARHTMPGLTHLVNVAVQDWLPAGFELENTRLLHANALPPLPETWGRAEAWKPDHVDYLDDKIAIFGTLQQAWSTFIYPVRAVSQGTFQLMPSTAEAMYLPHVRALAVHDQQVTITAPR